MSFFKIIKSSNAVFLIAVSAFLSAPIYAANAAPKSYAQENRVALVIGINNYTGNDKVLENSINDARAIAEKLSRLNFTVIKKEDLTSKDLAPTLLELKQNISPGSIVLLFFSGHGMQISGRNYLLLKDVGENIKTIEDVKNFSLSIDTFIDIIKQQKAQNAFVFLDACRENPFASKFNTVGLAEVIAPSGSLIALSTKPGGISWGLDGVAKNSLYTKHLAQHIDKENTPIDQVLKVVNKGVFVESKEGAERVEDIQEPWIQSSLYEDIYFRLAGPIKVYGNEQADTIAWFDIKDSGDETKYVNYLAQFPNGKFIVQAKKKLAELQIATSKQNIKLADIFIVNKQKLTDLLSTHRFFDNLADYLKSSNDPLSELELALNSNNTLAKAWWCALTTHERYKFPVRAQDGIKHCQTLVSDGYPIGMHLMGRAYLFGRGVPQDDKKALEYFNKAAAKGNAIAQNILGDMYAEGRGVQRNLKTAFDLYVKSANSGFSDGQNSVGAAYFHGHGVPQDYSRSAMWYQRAADQGNSWAQSTLGGMYLLGKGVPPDYAKAYSLISRSAEQGNSQAWLLLATIYESGAGHSRDINKARYWYQRAIDQASDPDLRNAASEALVRMQRKR